VSTIAYPPFTYPQDWREIYGDDPSRFLPLANQLCDDAEWNHDERHLLSGHPWCRECHVDHHWEAQNDQAIHVEETFGDHHRETAAVEHLIRLGGWEMSYRESFDWDEELDRGEGSKWGEAFEGMRPLSGDLYQAVLAAARAQIAYEQSYDNGYQKSRSRCLRFLVKSSGRIPEDPWPELETPEHAAKPRIVALDAFLDEPDPEVGYRVNELWPSGGKVLLAAQYKAGKTTLVGNIIRSIADGEPLLDRFATTPGTVVLLDDELDESMLRRWMRAQGIKNTPNVRLVSLRGRVHTFDLLNPAVRTEWAELLGGVDVLILDCLRPVLDALGLSEDKEAGRFLVALDALCKQATISEYGVVHHMGHNGERSRGDSAIEAWPDATWKLLRETSDDPASARYFSAYGRDVEIRESRVQYDETTRRLTLSGGSRKDSAATSVVGPLLDLLAVASRSKNQAETALTTAGNSRSDIRRAIQLAVNSGQVTATTGPRNATILSLAEPQLASSPDFADQYPREVTVHLASSPIGGELRASGEVSHINGQFAIHPSPSKSPRSCVVCDRPVAPGRTASGKTMCADCEAAP
jgi:hypothetical protein